MSSNQWFQYSNYGSPYTNTVYIEDIDKVIDTLFTSNYRLPHTPQKWKNIYLQTKEKFENIANIREIV
jgi:predicted transposase YdaD